MKIGKNRTPTGIRCTYPAPSATTDAARLYRDRARGRTFGASEIREIASAIGTSTYALDVDESGLTLTQRSNMGFGSILAMIGAVADTVLKDAGAKVY